MKQKYTKQSTSVKYKKYLPEIKRLIDEGNLTNLIDVFRSYNISSHWIAFLKEKYRLATSMIYQIFLLIFFFLNI